MDYEELVGKVIELLQREQRVSYRQVIILLKRQGRFNLDKEYLKGLKDEHLCAMERVGTMSYDFRQRRAR